MLISATFLAINSRIQSPRCRHGLRKDYLETMDVVSSHDDHNSFLRSFRKYVINDVCDVSIQQNVFHRFGPFERYVASAPGI